MYKIIKANPIIRTRTNFKRGSAKATFRRRLEILVYLKMHGPMVAGDINQKFKYTKGMIYSYLESLKATENVQAYRRFGDGQVFYKFVKYY